MTATSAANARLAQSQTAQHSCLTELNWGIRYTRKDIVPGVMTSVPGAEPKRSRPWGACSGGGRSARRMEAVVVDAQLHRGQVDQRGLDPVVGAAAGQVGQDLLDLGGPSLGYVP